MTTPTYVVNGKICEGVKWTKADIEGGKALEGNLVKDS